MVSENDGRPLRLGRLDLLLLGALVASSAWELVAIVLMPSLVGTHPVLLEVLQGSVPAMVSAGAFARVGRVPLWLAVGAAIPGLMAFDPLSWWAGRRFGRTGIDWYAAQRPGHARAVAAGERLFRRRGGWTLVGAYYLPVPNLVLYLLAGVTRMPLGLFLLLDGAGTLLHIAVSVGLGYALGQRGVDVATAISRWALMVTVALVVVVVLVAVWRNRAPGEPFLSVRRLAALDLALHRPWIILAEFAGATLLGVGLGALSLRAGLAAHPISGWEVAVGLGLAGIGLNYAPLLAHAVDLARSGAARSKATGELERPGRHGVRQLLLMVPFAMAVLGVAQLTGRKR